MIHNGLVAGSLHIACVLKPRVVANLHRAQSLVEALRGLKQRQLYSI